jgi:hypothetical protein
VTAYAFDLDGTLDRPGLVQLANDLYDAGHEVYVVTGGLADTGEWTMRAREAKLAALGVRYTQIVRVIDPDIGQIGRLKGEACERLSATVLVDDAPSYLAGASTGAVKLLVLPA